MDDISQVSRREALSGFAALSAAIGVMGANALAKAEGIPETADDASLEDFAAGEFEPWERAGLPPPSVPEMGRLIHPHLINLRLAWEAMFKSKPKLMEAVRRMNANADNPNLTEEMFKGFDKTAEVFREMAQLMDGALVRFACAISAVELEHGARDETESKS